jgi:hypothetical protein
LNLESKNRVLYYRVKQRVIQKSRGRKEFLIEKKATGVILEVVGQSNNFLCEKYEPFTLNAKNVMEI